MSNVLKSLRSLVKARERQGTRLEEAAAVQRGVLEQRRGEVRQAQARQHECAATEQRARDEREDMMTRTFTPAALRALDFTIQDLAAQTVHAAQAVKQAEGAVAAQQQVVAAALAAIRRNEQRIQSFKDRVDQLLRQRDQVIEEQADEEAEETAAARFSARRRLAREPTPHG